MYDLMSLKLYNVFIQYSIKSNSHKKNSLFNFGIFFLLSALGMHVKPCLEKLNQDVDHDVQHFANDAFESK